MSLPEVLLWRELKLRPGGFKFRRQHPIGEMTCDFACMSARLIIETDGEAHNMGDQPQRDSARDSWLADQGFRVIRIPAKGVFDDLNLVVESILIECGNTANEIHGQGTTINHA